jgi:hypothetical protein
MICGDPMKKSLAERPKRGIRKRFNLGIPGIERVGPLSSPGLVESLILAENLKLNLEHQLLDAKSLTPRS